MRTEANTELLNLTGQIIQHQMLLKSYEKNSSIEGNTVITL